MNNKFKDLAQVYYKLQDWEFVFLSRVNDKYEIGLDLMWSDSFQSYCINQEPELKQSELMLYFIDQELKANYNIMANILKNRLDAKHQCLRR